MNENEACPVIAATYRKAELPEHRGNPLIEAIPPFSAGKERLQYFGKYPPFNKTDRDLSANARMLAISRLDNYLEPLGCHEEVITKVALMMHAGYTYRNPATAEYRKELVRFYRQSVHGTVQPIRTSVPTTAPACSLFGVSGVGKSTVIERTLSFFPQTILHPKLGLEPQILWIKLDCPPDGSLKQFLKLLVDQVDCLLHTKYASLIKWMGVDELVVIVAKIVAKHHLGILVIDEIQNLLEASGVGIAKMLNFLVTLVNCAKVPIFVLGTPKAERYLQVLFREARRMGDYGSICWDRMERGAQWDWFLKRLSRYQWTKKPANLWEPAFSESIYWLSQGIHGVVVRLVQLSQQRAIRDGSECLTVGLIKQVASKEFVLIEPALDALRSGHWKRISRYEDFFQPGMIALNAAVETDDGALVKLTEDEEAKRRKVEFRLATSLAELGVEKKRAQQLLEELKKDKGFIEVRRQQLQSKIAEADLLTPDQSLIEQFKRDPAAKLRGKQRAAKRNTAQ
ncbi:hypothetical protein ABIF86_004527 [Bradyrhizobium japonicum]